LLRSPAGIRADAVLARRGYPEKSAHIMASFRPIVAAGRDTLG